MTKANQYCVTVPDGAVQSTSGAGKYGSYQHAIVLA